MPQPLPNLYRYAFCASLRLVANQDHVWVFLTCLEHFLILFDDLTNDFYLNDEEKRQHSVFSMAEFTALHQKEILHAINDAHRTGEDPQKALNEFFGRLTKAESEGSDESQRP